MSFYFKGLPWRVSYWLLPPPCTVGPQCVLTHSRCGIRGGYLEVVGFDQEVKAVLEKYFSAKLCSSTPGQVRFILNYLCMHTYVCVYTVYVCTYICKCIHDMFACVKSFRWTQILVCNVCIHFVLYFRSCVV